VFWNTLNALCVCLQYKHPRSMKRVIRPDKPVTLLLLLWSHKCDFSAEPRSRIIVTSAVKELIKYQRTASGGGGGGADSSTRKFSSSLSDCLFPSSTMTLVGAPVPNRMAGSASAASVFGLGGAGLALGGRAILRL
jgi:hypothetical protein